MMCWCTQYFQGCTAKNDALVLGVIDKCLQVKSKNKLYNIISLKYLIWITVYILLYVINTEMMDMAFWRTVAPVKRLGAGRNA